ncbi:MAG: translation elongation factor Ts [Spirochaetes bacterium]|nr:MAG: translation elongation factor Ts [Spirochaetota bacterium]
MAVTPKDVKKLRDKTGAGMLDCKNALVKADGDFAAAEKILKEQGLASADKRVGRATNNGSVFTCIEEGKAAMAELTCETDFVAKNDVFRAAGEKISKAVADSGSSEKSEALETMVKEAISILKENMLLGKVVYWSVSDNEVVGNYAHNDGQIGVIVKLSCDSAATAAKEEVKALAFDLALHAAAFNPTYLNRDAVSPAYLKDQEDIFTTQANNLGDKPEKIIKGIVQGKLNKHLSQICFVDQGFVKEDKKSVKVVVSETAEAAGGTIEIVDYAYIAVGQED